MQTLQPDKSVLQGGKYTIIKVLGQGGFGITYLAKRELFDDYVAIKEFFFKDYCERSATDDATVTMGGSVTASPVVQRFKEKFIKEARTISRLNHPGVVKVYDIFEENNTAYYVMERIDGSSLADVVNQRGALPEQEALSYIHGVAEALSYVHSQHINHLDIKPANIMLKKNGSVVLVDFGAAKQYDSVSGNQTSTTPVGISHGYAPIEQYKEGGVQDFSPQSDIYALGATLYKLLTGNTPPVAMDIMTDGLPAMSGISDKTQAAIKHAMSIKKTDRPESAAAFANELVHGVTGKKTAAPVQPVAPKAAAGKSNSKTIGIILAVIAIIGAIIAFMVFGGSSKSSTTTPTTPTATHTKKVKKNKTVTLAGTISNLPIHMRLEIKNNTVKGTYYYDKYASSKNTNFMVLSGSLSGSYMTIDESNQNGVPTGNFSGSYNSHDKTYSGTFSTTSGRSMDFRLSESYDY